MFPCEEKHPISIYGSDFWLAVSEVTGLVHLYVLTVYDLIDLKVWLLTAFSAWEIQRFVAENKHSFIIGKYEIICAWDQIRTNELQIVNPCTKINDISENWEQLESSESQWTHMRRCRMNRNKRCQNSFVCFSNEKVIFVFVGHQYDSM